MKFSNFLLTIHMLVLGNEGSSVCQWLHIGTAGVFGGKSCGAGKEAAGTAKCNSL